MSWRIAQLKTISFICIFFLASLFPGFHPGSLLLNPFGVRYTCRLESVFAFGLSDFRTSRLQHSAFRFPPRVAPGDTMIQPLRGWANSPTSICIFFRTRISCFAKYRGRGLKYQILQSSNTS